MEETWLCEYPQLGCSYNWLAASSLSHFYSFVKATYCTYFECHESTSRHRLWCQRLLKFGLLSSMLWAPPIVGHAPLIVVRGYALNPLGEAAVCRIYVYQKSDAINYIIGILESLRFLLGCIYPNRGRLSYTLICNIADAAFLLLIYDMPCPLARFVAKLFHVPWVS